MIEAIDNFLLGLEQPRKSTPKTKTTKRKAKAKGVGSVGTTKRKLTPKGKVKAKLRKTASRAKKTATRRVKKVIDSLVKQTGASIEKTISPKTDAPKPAAGRKKSTLNGTGRNSQLAIAKLADKLGLKYPHKSNDQLLRMAARQLSENKSGAKSKGAARLKTITNKAREIQKANPDKKWTACISEASKMV